MGTFQNLEVLKETQASVKETLKETYEEMVKPFVGVILKVMKNKDLDVFEAMKLIKQEDALYNKPNMPFIFSAAMVEIIEETYFT